MSWQAGSIGQRVDPRWYDGVVVTAVVVFAAAAAVASVTAPGAVIGAAAVVVVIALVARRADTATVVVLVLLYSNAAVVASRHLGLPVAIGAALPALLLAPLAYHFFVRRGPLRLGVAGPILVVLAIVEVASAFTSDDWSTAAGEVVAYLTNGVAVYLLMVNVLRSEQLVRRAAVTITGVAAGLGAVSLAHKLVSEWPGTRLQGFTELVRGDLLTPVDWEEYFSVSYPAAELRAAGPIGEPNFFAFILLLTVPYALAFAFAPRDRLERVVGLLSLPWLAAGIVVTYSRGAAVVIAVVASVLALTALLPRRTLVLLAGGAAALLFAVPDFARRLLRLATTPQLWIGTSDVGDAALSGRYSEMMTAAHTWAEHPLLGVGPGLFPAHYQRYAGELGFTVHRGPREAHNMYLEFAAELGTVGLVVVVILLFVLARQLLAVRRGATDPSTRAFTVAGVAVVGVVAVNGLFLHLAFERYLWLHVALLAAWIEERRRSEAALATRAHARRVTVDTGAPR